MLKIFFALILCAILGACSHQEAKPSLEGVGGIPPNVDREKVRMVVRNHLSEIKSCFKRAIDNDPGYHGVVVIEWTILDTGEVGDAHIKSYDVFSDVMEKCATTAVRGWSFPSPPVNETAIVDFPFRYSTK